MLQLRQLSVAQLQGTMRVCIAMARLHSKINAVLGHSAHQVLPVRWSTWSGAVRYSDRPSSSIKPYDL
jgi:hypothetical protein